MEKNPFEILGITPELVRRLDDDQLFKIVQSNYRLLQKVFHPDVIGGREENKRAHLMSLKLNRAFEQLDRRKDDNSFLYFRQQYEARLKRGLRKQMEKQQQQVDTLADLLASLKNHSVQFLLHYLENWETRKNGSTPELAASVFFLKNVVLGVNDVAVGYNFRHSSWNLGKNYKEIRFDQNRNMSYRMLSRSTFCPVNFIRLLGTVKADKLDIVPLLDKKVNKACSLSGKHTPSDFKDGGSMFDVQNTMDLDVFQESVMPHLSPSVSENSYLFSLHLETHKSALQELPSQVWLEGKIIRISPSQPSEE